LKGTRHSATTIAVSAATAFSLLGDQMLYAVLPVYFESLGITAIQVGLLLSINRWVRLLTNHLAHVASHRVRPRPLLAAAFLLGTLTTLGYALAASFTLLVVARLSWGLAWSFIRHIGVLEVIARAPAGAGGRTMGFYNGISRVGSVAGLLGGAALVDLIGYPAAVVALAITSLVSVVLILADHGLRESLPRVHTAPADSPAVRGASHVELALGFTLGIVGPGLVTATLGFVLQPYTNVGPSGDGLTAATLTGALLAIRFVIDSAAAPWLGAFTDRLGIRRAATAFFLIGGVMLAIATARTVSLIELGLVVTTFFVASTALQAGVASSVSGRGSAPYARFVTASDVGAAAGPLTGWIALDTLGYPAVGLLFGAGLYLVGAAVAWRFLR